MYIEKWRDIQTVLLDFEINLIQDKFIINITKFYFNFLIHH